MCGIAGIIQTAPASQATLIRNMTASLAHRGPDDETYWQNESGNVSLGHCRLSIIDLSSNGAQPMHYLDRYTIIHNGEIYNYPELKKELSAAGYTFRSNSDTEVILAAYAHWEEDCVDHFDGMFAFAIWDEKEQELFATRDRFGEKPFYYFKDQDQFIFASEIKAIHAAGIPRVQNLKMLFNFLTIGYIDNPAQPDETFFTNIHKLPPASRLFYTPADRQLVIENYWELNPEIEDKKITGAEATDKFQHLLRDSVKKRLRSDVSIGASLSGGLDSSSIVSLMHELEPNTERRSFTAIFPGFEKDEAVFAQTMATHAGMRPYTIEVSADDLAREWDQFMYHQEEPVGSASAFVQYKVFQLAAANDVKVLLDGQGADETVAGYHKYYKWYWQELFSQRRLFKSGELKKAKEGGVNEKFGVRNVIASLFPDLASVVLEQQYLAHALSQEDLTKEFIRYQSKEAYYTNPAVRNLNDILYFNTIVHGLEELLRYADRNSMAHGREVRLPFLNHELVEFIFSLPADFKIRDGWTKWILRKAMENHLPPAIAWRRDKTGFEPPQKLWMQNQQIQEMIHEARKKLVEEKVLKESVINKPIIAQKAYERNNYDWRYLTAAYFL